MITQLASLLGVKTLAIAGGAVLLVLLSTYGLGYWKGSRARASAPVSTVTASDKEGTKEKAEKKVSVRNVYGDEDIVEKKLTLPEVIFADGSRETTTKISRQVATKEASTSEAQVQIVYKDRVVTKEVTVPCPATNQLVSPFPAEAPEQPRFTAGPTVGRNFEQDKTVFGGAVGVRLGPVWLRLAGDTDPSASVGAEVQF